MQLQLTDVWTAAGVLLGFQVTSFAWRASREVQVGETDDITWLPPADMLNLLSMVVTVIGVFSVPIIFGTTMSFVQSAFGLALLLFVGYPFALAGHYDMYNNKTKRSYRYFPLQEKVVVLIVTIIILGYLWFAFIMKKA